MPSMDVFSGDAFNVTNMVAAINKAPVTPGRIASLGLFEPVGVYGKSVFVDEKQGVLELIPSKPWGAPPSPVSSSNRTARSLTVPSFPAETAVYASDVLGIRAFGSETEVEVVSDLVNERLEEMRQNFEATKEWLFAGALQGIVYDADGSTVLNNLFTTFGIAPPAQHDFLFGTATTDIKDICVEVIRQTEDALGMMTYDHIHALCGPDFFSRLTSHPEVKFAYQYPDDGAFLRTDLRRGFEFAGIVFEEYRAKVGSAPFIPADQAQFFPVGVRNLFKIAYAPADFVETAGTKGQPFYAKQEPMEYNRGVKILCMMNALPICTRPKVLQTGSSSN